MPPKKKRPLVWMPLTWKAIMPAGDFREYYLPLSKEEIEADLEHLGSLLAQAGGKRRMAGARLAVATATQPASSEECSPSSQQGEDENESANPSDQPHHVGAHHQAAAQQWAGAHKAGMMGGVGAAAGAQAAAEQQQQAGMA